MGTENPSWPDDAAGIVAAGPVPGGLLDGETNPATGNSLSLLMDPKQIADTGVPITVSDGAALRPLAAVSAPAPLSQRGSAPDPASYATQGELANQMLSNPYDPDGNAEAGGMMYNLGQLLQFHRGGAMDAQSYGASPAYGNYAFGVYNAAAGAPLPDVLDWANTYGKNFSTYPQNTPMDSTYTSIPADNVENITKGYNDYGNGAVRGKP